MFRCSACEATFPRWQGRCPRCNTWDTLAEVPLTPASSLAPSSRLGGAKGGIVVAPPTTPLRDLTGLAVERLHSGFGEIDRVVGGGFVPGGVTLLGGAPGIGKSTLALQWLGHFAKAGVSCLYQSGEESAPQLAQRASRLRPSQVADVEVLPGGDAQSLIDAIRSEKFQVVVVDSVQTLRADGQSWSAGSVTQLREVTAAVVDAAKTANVAVLLIGHITKEGALAGPKVLEHLVDTVLTFEGHPSSDYRVVRAVKNRFGPAQTLAIFEMRPFGLHEVPDPSAAFLAERPEGVSGSVVAIGTSGSRAFLVEVQALVAPAAGSPRRVASGCENDRLAIMLAVLERKLGYRFSDQDVFLSVAGGIDLSERALDLPIATTLASAHSGRVAGAGVALFGEVGLAGEVRGVPHAALRVAEALKLNLSRVIIPAACLRDLDPSPPAASGVTSLAAALDLALGK